MTSVRPGVELRVVDDLAEAALALWREAAPGAALLTGGGTPRPFYEALARLDGYPWERVTCFFSDERCVPADDDRSNAHMAAETLLSRVPASAHPIDGERCDADGYQRTLEDELGAGPTPWFDFALYGLGPDGHTASLFPGRPEVEVSDRFAVLVPEAGWEPFVPRVSLTVPALSSARLGVFLVSGEEKRDPLARLLAGDDIPATRMRPDRLVVVADHAAMGS